MLRGKIYRKENLTVEWEISDQDIELIEKLLLPDGAHFQDDARNVIRCWHSSEVSACPGSGKTTVLLAKLKLLEDKMPFDDGAGICVLSHTNVAVDEIRNRLAGDSDKLLGYPNYVGTIQSFFDKFVTMPYLRSITGRSIRVVDNRVYLQCMLDKIQKDDSYFTLRNMIRANVSHSPAYPDALSYVGALYTDNEGNLYVGRQRKLLAQKDKQSAEQYVALIKELLKQEGIIRYKDTYIYAAEAMQVLTKSYTSLFSTRFRYVFVDEYQDCNTLQRRTIDAIFDATQCVLIKIGDSDQAIYNSMDDETPDWVPQSGFLPIMTSCRYNQEIANVISRLKKDKQEITTLAGKTGVKPILFIFNKETIGKVVWAFIEALERNGLYDESGIYKVVGAVRDEKLTGLKIGSYWSGFDGTKRSLDEYCYWSLIDNIVKELSDGKLFEVERTVRKLLCRLCHYAKIVHPISGKEFTMTTIKHWLDGERKDVYRQWIYELSVLREIDRTAVDKLMWPKVNELLRPLKPQAVDIYDCLPRFFLNVNPIPRKTEESEKNILFDKFRGRKIEFSTVHGVKGETHDATLYLETEKNNGSDLQRILPYYGVGRIQKTKIYESSRKIAYVAMSRPRRLLCVAMKAETYEKSNGVFDADWEIIDLRK